MHQVLTEKVQYYVLVEKHDQWDWSEVLKVHIMVKNFPHKCERYKCVHGTTHCSKLKNLEFSNGNEFCH